MSYVRSLYHLVFRTRNSVPALSLAHSEELYRYIWGFCTRRNCILLQINGTEDHLHLLFRLHPEISLSAFVHDLKISSGNWLKQHLAKFPYFSGWAKAYAAFSYSNNEQRTIRKYISKQRLHHQKLSFAEEFRAFLEENDIPIDEKYFLKE